MIEDIDDFSSRFMRRFADRFCSLGGLLGGGSSTTVQKSETDPQIKALMLNNYATASGVADTPFQPYTGQRVAGFNPLQTSGQASLVNAANDPMATNTLNNAASGVGGILGYKPPTISAGQLSNTDLAPYMNPFTKDVIDQTINQQQHSRDIQGVADNASATAAHAFGGTRQAVQRANTTEGYDRNTGSLIAGLNSDNFNQARQGAQFDITNRLGASQQNASNDITGAGLRLNAGNSLANISDQQLQQALTRAGVINAVGDQQHSQQQDQNDAAYEEFMRQIGYPQQQQNIRNAAIGLLPTDGTVTGTSSKKYGLGDFLMAGISGASRAAAGGAFG